MTYRIGGEQYVALMAGVGEYDGYVDQLYGKKGRIVAFKLGGGEVPLRPALPPCRARNGGAFRTTIRDAAAAERR